MPYIDGQAISTHDATSTSETPESTRIGMNRPYSTAVVPPLPTSTALPSRQPVPFHVLLAQSPGVFPMAMAPPNWGSGTFSAGIGFEFPLVGDNATTLLPGPYSTTWPQDFYTPWSEELKRNSVLTKVDATLFALMVDIAMKIYVFADFEFPSADSERSRNPSDIAWGVLHKADQYTMESLHNSRSRERIPTYVLITYANMSRYLDCIREHCDITIKQKIRDIMVKRAMTRVVLGAEQHGGLRHSHLQQTRSTYAWVYGNDLEIGRRSALADVTAVSIRDWVFDHN